MSRHIEMPTVFQNKPTRINDLTMLSTRSILVSQHCEEGGNQPKKQQQRQKIQISTTSSHKIKRSVRTEASLNSPEAKSPSKLTLICCKKSSSLSKKIQVTSSCKSLRDHPYKESSGFGDCSITTKPNSMISLIEKKDKDVPLSYGISLLNIDKSKKNILQQTAFHNKQNKNSFGIFSKQPNPENDKQSLISKIGKNANPKITSEGTVTNVTSIFRKGKKLKAIVNQSNSINSISCRDSSNNDPIERNKDVCIKKPLPSNPERSPSKNSTPVQVSVPVREKSSFKKLQQQFSKELFSQKSKQKMWSVLKKEPKWTQKCQTPINKLIDIDQK